MPRDVFSRLARARCDEKFVLRNRFLGVAEIGIGRCACESGGKIFHARSFDSLETFSLNPRWEISLRENIVFTTRRLDAAEALDPEKFQSELNTLIASSVESDSGEIPEIPPPQEVGGNWYPDAARELIEEIHAGKLKKIVLSRSIRSVAETPISAEAIFGKLEERFGKTCTIFSVSHDGKTFLGATPELLVRLRDGILETEALAGSVSNFPGADTSVLARQLLENDKERREHRAVVDFIAEKLREIGLCVNFPEIPEVVVLPNILHLRTPIRAIVNPKTHVLDIVSALHPTPAMCGVPAGKAREKILSVEPFPRGYFAGPLGFYESDGSGFFAVGIRSAEIRDNEIRLFAGSGLVAGSTPNREFAEIDSKFSAILSLIRQ